MNVRELSPSKVWNFFEDLNAVPRPSKKEERVIFMDTGSGKGGTLSGAKLTFNNFGQLAIDTFLSFT
jgi:dipeptidase D